MTLPRRVFTGQLYGLRTLFAIIVVVLAGCAAVPPKQSAKPKLTPGELLAYSASVGDLALTRRLLDAGVNPDLANDRGLTPLLFAAEGGHGEVVGALLAKGANANMAGGKDNATPLMRAASNAHADILSRLLRADAKVDAQDRLGATALMWAALKGCHICADRLLQAGALVDVRGRTGETALWLAAVNSDSQMVALLMRAGANPALPNLSGSTPLQEAKARKKWDVVNVIESHTARK